MIWNGLQQFAFGFLVLLFLDFWVLLLLIGAASSVSKKTFERDLFGQSHNKWKKTFMLLEGGTKRHSRVAMPWWVNSGHRGREELFPECLHKTSYEDSPKPHALHLLLLWVETPQIQVVGTQQPVLPGISPRTPGLLTLVQTCSCPEKNNQIHFLEEKIQIWTVEKSGNKMLFLKITEYVYKFGMFITINC